MRDLVFFGGSDDKFQLLFHGQQRSVQYQIVIPVIGHRNVIEHIISFVFQTSALYQVPHRLFLGRVAFFLGNPVEKDSVGGDIGRHQQMYFESALYEMPSHSGIENDVFAAHTLRVFHKPRIDYFIVMMILLAPFVQFQSRYPELRGKLALDASRVEDFETVFRIQPFAKFAFPGSELPVYRYKHYSSPSNKSPTTESTSAASSFSSSE